MAGGMELLTDFAGPAVVVAALFCPVSGIR